MTKYWWVNHNQTFAHERRDGYLWSPKREASGAGREASFTRTCASHAQVTWWCRSQIDASRLSAVSRVKRLQLKSPPCSEQLGQTGQTAVGYSQSAGARYITSPDLYTI